MATGRVPNSDLLNVAAAGLEVDEHGHVRTDETYAYTSLIFLKDRALLSYYVADEKTGRISSRFRSLPVNWFYQGEK